MSEVLLHDSDGLMLLCIRGHCEAGYIRTVVKGRDGRVHTLYCLGLRGARFGINSLPEVSGRYLRIPTRELRLWSKESKTAWAAHEISSHEIEKIRSK